MTVQSTAAWSLGAEGWGYIIFPGTNLIEFACGSITTSCPMEIEIVPLTKGMQRILQMGEHNSTFYADCLLLVHECLMKMKNNWK
jgi:ribonuclease HI